MRRAVAGVAVLVLALAGCGSGGGTRLGGDGGLTTITAQLTEPGDLRPGNTDDFWGRSVESLLYAGLTTYDPRTGRAVNLVAKTIETKDEKHWTITLKPGWTFHDGEPVTAQSFVGAWTAAVRLSSANASFFTDLLKISGADEVGPGKSRTDIPGLRAVGDKTIELTLDEPNSNVPLILGNTAFFPVPESVIKSDGWKKYNERPIGDGPYRMAEPWRHNRYIKLARYGAYPGPDKGRPDSITFRIYSDPQKAYNDALDGALDVAQVPPSRLGSASGEFGKRYVRAPSSSFVFLGFPLWKKEYQDIRVREAFSMAIDREQIAEILYHGAVIPAKGLVTPLIHLGHRDDACGEACGFHPVKAKRLLDESGFPLKSVELWYDSGAGNDDWVEAVANQLRRTLGIDVQLKAESWAAYKDATTSRKVTGPYRLGWLMDYPSPEDYLAPLYGTNGASNGPGYSNHDVDGDLARAAAATTPDAAVPYYHEAEDQVLDDLPVAPLWFGTNQYVHSERTGNLTFDPLSYLRYGQIEVKS
ncbi:MAG: ABC transporter substrate-binding protein [Streptosporangiales bacterium]|nr:ABC transporter substrate-binding protein [Streptosporangiales bacterium]MBO0890707.1 ABC transporter substrate-binding protein [Acidothermales bacterium]